MDEIKDLNDFMLKFNQPEYINFNRFCLISKDVMMLGDTHLYEVRLQHKACLLGFNVGGATPVWNVKFSSVPEAKWYKTNDNGTRWSYFKSDIDGCFMIGLESIPEECRELAFQWYNESLDYYKSLLKKISNEFEGLIKQNWLKN